MEAVGEDACVFIIEHIIQYMIVPGKAENWVVIIDLNGVGITNIPTAVRDLLRYNAIIDTAEDDYVLSE